MGPADILYRLLPPRIRQLPADLAAIVALLGLADLAIVLPGLSGSPVRFVLVLPLLTILPGYAVTAALYPERGGPGQARHESNDVGPETDDPAAGAASDAAVDAPEAARTVSPASDALGIDWYERVTLAIGLSIALVPLLAYGTVLALGNLQLTPVLVTVNAATLAATWYADRRRRALPEPRRFRVPYRQWIERIRASLLDHETRLDRALTVGLVLSILLLLGTGAYVLTTPKPTDAHTEFYLLTESENGTLVAGGYPTDFRQGVPQELVVGITNQEHGPRSYSVVGQLQEVSESNGSLTVLRRQQVAQFSTRLRHEETWTRPHVVSPDLTGDRLRLTYLLYEGEPPASPRIQNADQSLHVWVNVSALK